MSDIFISYSHQDKAYCNGLVTSLGRWGFNVWIDDRLEDGTIWPKEIQDRLEVCGALIVVMTPASCDSTWVQNEVTFALNLRKPIFPLQLAGNVWFALSSVQSADVRGGKLPPEEFFRRLGEVVRSKPLPDILTIVKPIELELIRILAGYSTAATQQPIGTPKPMSVPNIVCTSTTSTSANTLLPEDRWEVQRRCHHQEKPSSRTGFL